MNAPPWHKKSSHPNQMFAFIVSDLNCALLHRVIRAKHCNMRPGCFASTAAVMKHDEAITSREQLVLLARSTQTHNKQFLRFIRNVCLKVLKVRETFKMEWLKCCRAELATHQSPVMFLSCAYPSIRSHIISSARPDPTNITQFLCCWLHSVWWVSD